MAIISDTVSVGSTATALHVPFKPGFNGLAQELLVRPTNGVITLGRDKTITAGGGFTLDSGSGEFARIPLAPGDEVWAITSSGTVTVQRLVTGSVA